MRSGTSYFTISSRKSFSTAKLHRIVVQRLRVDVVSSFAIFTKAPIGCNCRMRCLAAFVNDSDARTAQQDSRVIGSMFSVAAPMTEFSKSPS